MDPAEAVSEYLAALATERGLSANTVSAYRRDLAQYVSYLGVDDVAAVTTADPEGFVAGVVASGAAPATAKRKLAAVRGLHRFLVAEGITDHDPAARIDAVRQTDALPKALGIDEVAALLEAPDPATPLGVRDRALLELMYASGARVAETVGLQTADIDLETRTALVTGKGDRQRVVPLGSHAVAAVEAYLPVRLDLKRGRDDSGWLFLNNRGGQITRQGVFVVIRRHATAAGIDPARVSPHVLRHSAATHMVEGGADLRTVQELLGHASISTTQVYTRVSPRHLYEVFVTTHPRGR